MIKKKKFLHSRYSFIVTGTTFLLSSMTMYYVYDWPEAYPSYQPFHSVFLCVYFPSYQAVYPAFFLLEWEVSRGWWFAVCQCSGVQWPLMPELPSQPTPQTLRGRAITHIKVLTLSPRLFIMLDYSRLSTHACCNAPFFNARIFVI